MSGGLRRSASRSRASANRLNHRSGQPWRRRLKRDWPLIVMVLPCLLVLGIFHYLPLMGNIIAFQSYSPFEGITGSPWVGLENFSRLMSDSDFWQSIRNTLVIMLVELALFFPIPIVLALMLNSVNSNLARGVVQSVLYLPHFLSWIIVITLYTKVFGGAGIISAWSLGNGGAGFDLLSDPSHFPWVVALQAVWKDAGWGIIIFLAALAGVSSELHEAAAVDGAGRWRRLWHITLPAIRPVVVLLLILRLGDALNVGFEQILLQRDAVGAQYAEVLDTYVYFSGLLQGDFSYGAAAGIFKGVVGLVLILAANKAAHMLGEDGIIRSGK